MRGINRMAMMMLGEGMAFKGVMGALESILSIMAAKRGRLRCI